MRPKTQDPRPKAGIILALDVDSFAKAKYFVNKLYPQIKIFKVGIQLFTHAGPRIVEYINKKGAQVFLDLKFFDIPHSVANAVRQAVRLRVKMLTLHILGEQDMLKQALKAAKQEAKRLGVKRPLLIGVTVLTSKETTSSDVLTLAKIGIECGLDGVVCSAREAALIRREIKKKFLIVTPGIRPEGVSSYDQKRTATVKEAIKAGSDFLVIGRPILEAKEPFKVLEKIKL
jgi:orotidine-5'-phosphate decarboxylase